MQDWSDLLEVLGRARALGFLGPGDPARHLAHALGFVEAALNGLGGPPTRFADLGTGGGVPGLVLALAWPDARATFIESSARRAAALRNWVVALGIAERTRLLEGRAEEWAHAEDVREAFDLVTARSFARPATTAEVASGLVRPGGVLVVSEPPTSGGERWPSAQLRDLGFGPAAPVPVADAHFACLRKEHAAPADAPRATVRLAKRPRW